MHAYSVSWLSGTPRLVPGLPLTRDPHPHVAVGAEGPGRELARVPVQPDLAASGDVLREAGVRIEGGSPLLIAPDPDEEPGVLVLIRIPGGFRGGAVFGNATPSRCSRRADGPVDVRELLPVGWNEFQPVRCPVCGDVFLDVHRQLWDGGVVGTHPAWERGGVPAMLPAAMPWEPGAVLLAYGADAEGAAGRMGGPHAQGLWVLRPGARIRVHRTGRLYGEAADIIVTAAENGGAVTVQAE